MSTHAKCRKNQGIRIMNKFKEEAKAMGVELPEVTTELNEDTGKPAFCKIFDEKSDQKVDQFLEQAKQQGKMRRNAHTQTSQIQMGGGNAEKIKTIGRNGIAQNAQILHFES